MIVNNTIVDSASGLELYEKTLGQDGGHAVGWNYILWNNANSIVLLHSSTLSAEYSDIAGEAVYPGTSNLNLNPLFVNADLHDYRLAANSPAVASGTSGTTLRAIFPVGSYLLDTDGDGLPDTWEQSHILDFNHPDDASTEMDQDGLLNLQEFLAGTNPEDPASNLRLAALPSGWRWPAEAFFCSHSQPGLYDRAPSCA